MDKTPEFDALAPETDGDKAEVDPLAALAMVAFEAAVLADADCAAAAPLGVLRAALRAELDCAAD